MKRVLLTICVCVAAFASSAQAFTVRGKIEGIDQPVEVTLTYGNESCTKTFNDGEFEFKGVHFPVEASIRVVPHHPTLKLTDTAYWEWAKTRMHLAGVRNFFLEGDVTIEGRKIDEAVVSGGNQAIYEAFRAKERKIRMSLDSLRGKGRNGDNASGEDDDDAASPARKGPSAAANKLIKQLNELRVEFVEKHPDSYFSLELTEEQSNTDVGSFRRMLALLSKRMRSTERYSALKVMSDGYSMKKIGHPATGFTLQTAEGKSVSLSSYRGKYVLVDFWASWCGPCREENPNVVRAYNQFKDKNFEVLSISVDANRAAWVNAVKEDGLPWTQVLDLKGKNSTALAYAVTGIPDNVLIDPQGKIVATGLRGAGLQAALSKFLK